MSIRKTVFVNNYETAHTIQRTLKPTGPSSRPLTLRPFNRFDTDFTEWWFVPSTDWPAFQFGKLLIRRYPNDSTGLMYCGYHVEKGYHSKVSGFEYISPAEIIHSDWYWNKFVIEAQEGRVDSLCNQVSNANQIDLRLLIEANPLKPGDAERPLPGSGDSVEFGLECDKQNWRTIKSSNDVLSELNDSISIAECVDKVQLNEDLEFYWIDLMIAVTFSYGDSEIGSINEDGIWDLSLEPWQSWLS